MTMFWGNSWYQVIHDELAYCGVLMLSKYPSADGGYDSKGNEVVEVIMPSLPENSGFSFIEHKDQRSALLACKRHILVESRLELLSHLWVVNDAQCDLEEHKVQLKSDPTELQYWESKISSSKETIQHFQLKAKKLKQIRKSKIKEFLESEIVDIATKQAQEVALAD